MVIVAVISVWMVIAAVTAIQIVIVAVIAVGMVTVAVIAVGVVTIAVTADGYCSSNISRDGYCSSTYSSSVGRKRVSLLKPCACCGCAVSVVRCFSGSVFQWFGNKVSLNQCWDGDCSGRYGYCSSSYSSSVGR